MTNSALCTSVHSKHQWLQKLIHASMYMKCGGEVTYLPCPLLLVSMLNHHTTATMGCKPRFSRHNIKAGVPDQKPQELPPCAMYRFTDPLPPPYCAFI